MVTLQPKPIDDYELGQWWGSFCQMFVCNINTPFLPNCHDLYPLTRQTTDQTWPTFLHNQHRICLKWDDGLIAWLHMILCTMCICFSYCTFLPIRFTITIAYHFDYLLHHLLDIYVFSCPNFQPIFADNRTLKWQAFSCHLDKIKNDLH